MKKNIAIVTLLIIALIGAFSLKSNAQERDKCPSYVSQSLPDTLLGDETTISFKGDQAVIKCDNDEVFNIIFKTHGTLFKRFTCSWKTDRHGRYKHYTVYLSKGDAELIQLWAKTNL